MKGASKSGSAGFRRQQHRVSPSTFTDENGDWITLHKVDSSTLIPRPATPEEIEAAQREATDKVDDGATTVDSTTRVTGENLPPPDTAVVSQQLKDMVDEINQRDAAKRDDDARYRRFSETEDRADAAREKRGGKQAGPQL